MFSIYFRSVPDCVALYPSVQCVHSINSLIQLVLKYFKAAIRHVLPFKLYLCSLIENERKPTGLELP